MTLINWKMTLVREFSDGFCSVLISQSNGRSDFWVLSDSVIHELMERQEGLETNLSTT